MAKKATTSKPEIPPKGSEREMKELEAESNERVELRLGQHSRLTAIAAFSLLDACCMVEVDAEAIHEAVLWAEQFVIDQVGEDFVAAGARPLIEDYVAGWIETGGIEL